MILGQIGRQIDGGEYSLKPDAQDPTKLNVIFENMKAEIYSGGYNREIRVQKDGTFTCKQLGREIACRRLKSLLQKRSLMGD